MRVPTITSTPLPPGHTRAAVVLRDLRAADVPLSPTAIRDAHDRGSWLPASVGLAQVPLVPLPDTAPLTQTDWSARLASDWISIYTRFNGLKAHTAFAANDFITTRHDYAAAEKALSADLADLFAAIDDDRSALCGDVNAERALLADMAPVATLNGEVA